MIQQSCCLKEKPGKDIVIVFRHTEGCSKVEKNTVLSVSIIERTKSHRFVVQKKKKSKLDIENVFLTMKRWSSGKDWQGQLLSFHFWRSVVFLDHVTKSSRKGLSLVTRVELDNLPSRVDFYYSRMKR